MLSVKVALLDIQNPFMGYKVFWVHVKSKIKLESEIEELP